MYDSLVALCGVAHLNSPTLQSLCHELQSKLEEEIKCLDFLQTEGPDHGQ